MDIHPAPTARKTQLVQSSLILPALLQATSLVSPNPFLWLFPFSNTPVWGHPGCAETRQELRDPAMLHIQTDSVFFQGTKSRHLGGMCQQDPAFLCHIQLKSSDGAVEFRSVQSLN